MLPYLLPPVTNRHHRPAIDPMRQVLKSYERGAGLSRPAQRAAGVGVEASATVSAGL